MTWQGFKGATGTDWTGFEFSYLGEDWTVISEVVSEPLLQPNANTRWKIKGNRLIGSHRDEAITMEVSGAVLMEMYIYQLEAKVNNPPDSQAG